jgi:tRNA (mo5U34)-methyltransferase
MPPAIRERIGAMRWYHTIELPGATTPGEYDLRPVVSRLPIPDSLAGMRCLDVGSRDGFYAFELERRGAAEVVSLDLDDPAKIDFGRVRPDPEGIRRELEIGNEAFAIAREALDSKVQREFISAYDLDTATVGEFDFAVIGTLLLHLRDPVAALRGVRRVLNGRLLSVEPVMIGVDLPRRKPVAEALMHGGPFWWAMNPAALRRVIEAAGFQVEDQSRPFLIPNGERPRADLLESPFRRPWRQIPQRLSWRRGALHVWTSAVSDPGEAAT